MVRRVTVAVLAALATLVAATPARADTYTVTGSGDDPSPSGCVDTGGGTHTCTMLRAAVLAANAPGRPGLHPHHLFDREPVGRRPSRPPTTRTSSVCWAVRARRRSTRPACSAPAFQIGNSATVTLGLMTIRGGTNTNVDVIAGSEVLLAYARVTGAVSGPGVVNEGTLDVTFRLSSTATPAAASTTSGT